MDIFALLRDAFPTVRIVPDFSFARHTTLGCGGHAAACAYPPDAQALEAIVAYLERRGIPHCFLGVGANVLASDGDYDGVVVKFSAMDRISRDGETVIAEAGVTGRKLMDFARGCGIGGMEFLAGIPTSVGGATVMNAGVRDAHLGDLVERVIGVAHGKLRIFSRAACNFSEKSSVFQQKIAVACVVLHGASMPPEKIAQNEAAFRARRAGLPKGRSAGCIFVNPPGLSAGQIIDACGLKGRRVGGAFVSPQHANFILSDGASAEDVASLIALVRRNVFDKTGILLREEIRRLP